MEIWLPIPGFRLHEVSNLGRVRNHKTGHVLAGQPNWAGYHLLQLGHLGARPTVHSLVMLAFVGPRPEDYDINHKDGNKANNRLENLEYVTKSQNKRHSVNVLGKGRGESHGNAKITEDDVREIRRLAAAGLKHGEIAERFLLTRANVSYIVRRSAWAHVA